MKVFVTRDIPEKGLQQIEHEFDQVGVYHGDTPIPRDQLEQEIKDVHGLLCLLTDTIDRALIEQADQLQVISNYAVGYDNIDITAATEKGILVTNTPGVLTRSTAELTWSLLLATVRRVVEADQFVRDGSFKGWSPTLFRGLELGGKTLGIFGAGRIGQAVGRRAGAFDMSVLYSSRSRKNAFEEDTGASYVELEELLQESDVLSLHCPSTDETRGLLDEEALRTMKPGAYLINTARGDVVDEGALVKLLEEGHLAGAGLDVYENEPDVHPGLLDLDNVLLLPHIGSATHETRDNMAVMAAQNLIQGLQGEEPPHPVNKEVLTD
jgi:glyoxylate reductase